MLKNEHRLPKAGTHGKPGRLDFIRRYREVKDLGEAAVAKLEAAEQLEKRGAAAIDMRALVKAHVDTSLYLQFMRDCPQDEYERLASRVAIAHGRKTGVYSELEVTTTGRLQEQMEDGIAVRIANAVLTSIRDEKEWRLREEHQGLINQVKQLAEQANRAFLKLYAGTLAFIFVQIPLADVVTRLTDGRFPLWIDDAACLIVGAASVSLLRLKHKYEALTEELQDRIRKASGQ